MKKKFKKSTLITAALLIYVTAMAIYFLPRNTEISNTEKYITLGISYLIVALLWFVLRKKEQIKDRRGKDIKHNNTLDKDELYDKN